MSKIEMKKFKAPPPVADINVTPMVDVMLVMLIIFMVITPMLSKGVSVDLVKTKQPDRHAGGRQERRRSFAPSRATARPSWAPRQLQPEDLPHKVKDLLTNRLDKTVFVKADARARYERVVDVVDNLRAAGVDQLGLLTDQIQEHGQAGSACRSSAVRSVVKNKRFLKGAIICQWQLAGRGGPKADINMTPMIDVLLVLIIIFMVITPLTPQGT